MDENNNSRGTELNQSLPYSPHRLNNGVHVPFNINVENIHKEESLINEKEKRSYYKIKEEFNINQMLGKYYFRARSLWICLENNKQDYSH